MILITGAAGFIGKYFVEKFSEKEMVLATDRKKIMFKNENIVFVRGELENKTFLEELFKKYNIEIVIHLAAEKNLAICEQSSEVVDRNIMFSYHLIELSKKINAHFIFLSSDQVFDGRRGNYMEKVLPNPINNYGKYKAKIEKVAMSYKKASICRTALVFGFTNDLKVYNQDEVENQSEFVMHVVARLLSGKEIKLPKDEIISPTVVDLLFEQIYLIIKRHLYGIFHCCGNETISRYEFGRKIAKYFNLDDTKIIPIEGKRYRPKNVSLNSDNSEKLLGMKGVGIDEMLGMIMVSREDKLLSVQISYMNCEYVWIIGKGVYDRNMQEVGENREEEIKSFVQSQGLNVKEWRIKK